MDWCLLGAGLMYNSDNESEVVVMSEKTFTKDELSKFDGQNGNRAYVAIDGVVYDMTDVPAWKNGQHHGNTAGRDLSQEILKSPHGKSVLTKLPVVGKLV